jgi:predicted peptidase
MNILFRPMLRSPFRLGLTLLSAASVAMGQTQESKLMEARTVKIASTTMGYRLFKPKNYSASQKYPIVVSLHGVGERGTDNTRQVDYEDLAHPWIEDSIQARVPHFIMIPQCPPDPLTWGGMGGSGTLSETGKGIMDALEKLKQEFSLDTNRIYITGLSMGGAGTYHLLAMKPGYFAAAAPCAAGGDTTAILNITKTPIWHSHGSLDGNPPAGRRMANAMEGRGIKVVRFVSQAAITAPSLNAYSTALKNGTKPEDLCFKNPTGPVTYDSLKKAVEGGADYLYSELTGGDHRSGWMIAWHNPLMAKWMFSKVKGGSTVSLAPKALVARREGNRTTLVFGPLSEVGEGRAFSPLGRRFDARTPGSGTTGRITILQPAR